MSKGYPKWGTVSVLLGGLVPFIDTYLLIGESYVRGIMNGEALCRL